MLIIDTHVHTGDNWEEPIETLLYHMQANGVSGAVLAQLNGHYDNSYILDCAKRYGNKFKAVVIVDNKDPQCTKTLEEMKKQGASGMRVNLRKGFSASDPLFKLCGELGLVVSAIGKAENFGSAEFLKILDTCPKTQFCCEHLARDARPKGDFCEPPHDGFRPILQALAARPNTSLKVPGLGEIVPRPLRFPPGSAFPFDKIPPLFDMAKEAFGIKRMMWASNFPPCAKVEGYKHALEWVRDYPAFKNGDDVEWLMGKSAAKVWGF